MEIATADALFRYFEELYGLNQNVIALCGTDLFDIKIRGSVLGIVAQKLSTNVVCRSTM